MARNYIELRDGETMDVILDEKKKTTVRIKCVAIRSGLEDPCLGCCLQGRTLGKLSCADMRCYPFDRESGGLVHFEVVGGERN